MKHISQISVIFLNVEFYLDHFQSYYFKKIKRCISLRVEVLIKQNIKDQDKGKTKLQQTHTNKYSTYF